MRLIFTMLIFSLTLSATAQFSIPAYNIVRDSASRITVFHAGNAEKLKLSASIYTDTISLINPNVKLRTGIVDHKTLTGEMLVREYYFDSAMIGYIEFDGRDIMRELYFDAGKVFLEKRYAQGTLTSTDTRSRTFVIIAPVSSSK